MGRKLTSYLFVFVLLWVMALTGCEDERYLSSHDGELKFTVDTLMFDTIFTTIGSTTQSFRVINPSDQPITISSIRLAGGVKSSFRLNIDGVAGNEVSEVELAAYDSMFIFVEVTIDPNGTNQPMVVKDSVLFSTDEKQQCVTLMAWGQDFIPIEKGIITTTTWKADKPYVIYDFAYVDSGQVLTIEPGARIYFHQDATLYVKGSVQAVGQYSAPIIFTSDRREKMYEQLPNQWWGIVVYPNSVPSRFEQVEIRNANIGLQVGIIEQSGAGHVVLNNVKIENMSYAGIFALKSKITAANLLVANCGYYCVTLLIGGNYQFTHCTLANYWGGYSVRKTASLVISNQLKVQNGTTEKLYTGSLEKAIWRNSVIWGNLASEIEFGKNEETPFNYFFDHCIVKLPDSIQVTNEKYFRSVRKNVDPKFKNYSDYQYDLDTLSAAKDAGNIQIGETIPLDMRGQSRLNDSAPDLGAFERIEKTKKSARQKSQ